MQAFIRAGFAGVALAGVALPSAAAPTTLRDGATEVVIDPASQDGIHVWSMNGVDHLKKEWYWMQGLGFKGSLDQLSIDATVVTDSDGDGDDDTLVVRYREADDRWTVQIAWRLQDVGLQLIGPPPVRHSTLTTQIEVKSNIGDPDGGSFDLDFIRYVDFDLGGTVEDEQVTIGPDQPDPFAQPTYPPYNQARWNLTVQEEEAAAFAFGNPEFARYRSAVAMRPPQTIAGNFVADADAVLVDISDYPDMLNDLNDPGAFSFDNFNSETFSNTGEDHTWSQLVHIDTGGGNSHGWSIVEELEAVGSNIVLPSLPGLLETYLQLVLQQQLQPLGGRSKLRVFGKKLEKAVRFGERGNDNAKCKMLGIAEEKSDGLPAPTDWVQGEGLPVLQEELHAVMQVEGCNGNGQVPPPIGK